MHKLPFDLKEGDFCFAYNKGIHRVVHILFPAQGRASTALISLESILDSNFNPMKNKKSTCDVAWCRKIDKQELLKSTKNSHCTQINNVEKYIV